ncbi:head maturation protease, ClpP-related [Gordonia caeni]|uniref:ATP-dependent Clp protease proteolytic subunit n=1 Tax=Gordonia caeni TaxID=1007097 RepID=A0ABP7PBR1_9ACTN
MTITSLSRLLADPAARTVVADRDQPADTTPACRIGAITNSSGRSHAEVFIYGAIHPWPWEEIGEVGANGFVTKLSGLDVDDITVRIHSPGGDVYDALAITNALKAHPAYITVVVDGLAASAASFIAQAGDKIIIRPNAEMMIHDPSGGVRGNSAQLVEYSKWLDRAADNIAAIYADRAGGDPGDWRTAMRAETWYSAAEAVEAGLADETHSDPAAETAATEDDRDGEAAAAAFADLRRAYAHQCRADAPAPFMPSDQVGRQEGSDMALRQEIAARLGIAEDADESTVLNKIDELTELATTPDKPSDAAQLTALAEAHGLRVVDVDWFTEMEAAIEQAAADAQARRLADQAQVVENAIEAGKITPARREHFVALMAADEDGTAALLDSLPANLAVPTDEIGRQPDTDEAEKSAYDALFNPASGDSK